MIHREGYRLIAAVVLLLAAANIVVFRWLGISSPAAWLFMVSSLLVTAFLMFFFRSPARPADADDETVISPADGKVVVIEEAVEKEYLKDKRLQVSIFMSPFNVHCNRYPVTGIVRDVIYHPGKYLVAWHPKSSELNERCTVVIETDSGELVVVRQIAGAIARRIVTYATPGQRVNKGDELGFIKFGSRVDLFMPPGFLPDVSLRQKVVASKTVVGRF